MGKQKYEFEELVVTGKIKMPRERLVFWVFYSAYVFVVLVSIIKKPECQASILRKIWMVGKPIY